MNNNGHRKRVLIKLSGESLKISEYSIIDNKFVYQIAKQIRELISTNEYEVGIVIGGGNIWRGEQAKKIDRDTADWMGMLSTVINSLYLQSIFQAINQPVIVMNAFDVKNCGEVLDHQRANDLLKKNYAIIFGGGTGKTHLSTDTAAAMRATEMGFSEIWMGKNNVDGVYDADPNKVKDANFLEKISYSEIINKKLKIIDSEAAKILQEKKIVTYIFELSKEDSIIKLSKDLIKKTIVH